MMMKKSIIYLALLFPAFVSAQQLLSLEAAIDLSLKNNYNILIAKNNTEISKLNNNYGMAGGLPVISISTNDNNSLYNLQQRTSSGVEINKNNVTSSSFNAGVNAGIILFNGFKVSATKDKLSLLQSQSEIKLNCEIQNTIAAIMAVYYDIVKQQSYLKIIENSIDVSTKKLEIISERLNLGMANEANILQAKMDLNASEQNYKGQVLKIEQAKIDLLQLIGEDNFYSFTIVDSINVDKEINKDSILNYLQNNPELIFAMQQVKINEQIAKEIKAQKYPSIRINTGYNFNYSSSSSGFNLLTQNYGPTIGASLQIPLYNGNIYKTQQDVAMYNINNAVIYQENLNNSLISDALKTYLAYKSTLEQIESQQTNFENAAKLVNIVVQRFELSQSTILDLKAAQESYENAGYLLINLKYNAKIAEIEIKRLTFKLTY